jgi:hypothetical protein
MIAVNTVLLQKELNIMKKDIKIGWVAALRSGKYRQRKYALCCDGEYCCLGVLCEINGLHKESKDNDPDGYNSYSYKDTSDSENVPEAFADEIELSEKHRNTLTHMNDTNEKTFAEIADWIEENL